MRFWKTDIFKGGKKIVIFQDVIDGLDLHTTISETGGIDSCEMLQDSDSGNTSIRII